jgi:hypothetical protein
MEAIRSVYLLPGLSSVEAAEYVCDLAAAAFVFNATCQGTFEDKMSGNFVGKHKCCTAGTDPHHTCGWAYVGTFARPTLVHPDHLSFHHQGLHVFKRVGTHQLLLAERIRLVLMCEHADV